MSHNTKLHLAVDAHGMLLREMITQGTDADCQQQAVPLMAGITVKYLLADRGIPTLSLLSYIFAV